MYTSAKDGVNCGLLHRYLLSCIYPEAFPCNEEGQVRRSLVGAAFAGCAFLISRLREVSVRFLDNAIPLSMQCSSYVSRIAQRCRLSVSTASPSLDAVLSPFCIWRRLPSMSSGLELTLEFLLPVKLFVMRLNKLNDPARFLFTEIIQTTDAAFIPAGWDSKSLIDGLLSPDKTPWGPNAAFEDVVAPPAHVLRGADGGIRVGADGTRTKGSGIGGSGGSVLDESIETVESEEAWLNRLGKQMAGGSRWPSALAKAKEVAKVSKVHDDISVTVLTYELLPCCQETRSCSMAVTLR